MLPICDKTKIISKRVQNVILEVEVGRLFSLAFRLGPCGDHIRVSVPVYVVDLLYKARAKRQTPPAVTVEIVVVMDALYVADARASGQTTDQQLYDLMTLKWTGVIRLYSIYGRTQPAKVKQF